MSNRPDLVGPAGSCCFPRRSREPPSIGGDWWSQTGSNRRPHACKARALPTELWPPKSLLGTGVRYELERQVLVGPGRLELPTLRLSGVRSNHLSYEPLESQA